MGTCVVTAAYSALYVSPIVIIFLTQMQVEGGIPLHICLSRFTRWLQNLQLNMGVTFPSKQTSSAPSASQKLCAFLTWSGKVHVMSLFESPLSL